MVKHFMNRKMKGIPKEDFRAMYSYLYQTFMKSGSGEHALAVMFYMGVVPKFPVIEELKNLTQGKLLP